MSITRMRLPDMGAMREVTRISVPLMFGMVGNLVLMLVDRICLSRYSADALRASGPAIFTATTVIMLATGAVGTTRSYVAQAHGRGDERGALDETANGCVLALLVCAVLLLATPLLTWVPRLSGEPAPIEALEAQFLGLSTLYGSVMTLNMALSSYFNGVGRTRVPMTVGILGQAVGIVMTIGLVFGRFGLPELGMRGSALGTLSAVSVMCLGYVACLPRSFAAGFGRLLHRGRRQVAQVIWLRLRRGAPAGGSLSLEELGQTSFVWLAGVLGSGALAADNVALALNYAAVIPLLGLGMGCTVLCGKAVGAGRHSDIPHIMRVTLTISGVYVALVAVFQVAVPTLLLSPFGLDGAGSAAAGHAAVDTSRVLWTYSAAFMFSVVGSGVLECLGLARFGFVVRVIVMWGLCVPVITLLVLLNRGDTSMLPVMWLIFSFFEAAMAAACLWRIRRAVAVGENWLHSSDPVQQNA